MENKKTISQLNEKMWYRALKVIFIFTFVIVLVIFNLFSIYKISHEITLQQLTNQYSQNHPSNDTQETNLSQLPPPPKGVKGITLNELNTKINTQINYGSKLPAGFKINPSKTLPTGFKINPAPATNTDPYLNFNNPAHFQTVAQWAAQNNIKLPSTPPTSGKIGLGSFLKLFVDDLIILLIFEAIRRAFYYIVFGKIKPEK